MRTQLPCQSTDTAQDSSFVAVASYCSDCHRSFPHKLVTFPGRWHGYSLYIVIDIWYDIYIYIHVYIGLLVVYMVYIYIYIYILLYHICYYTYIILYIYIHMVSYIHSQIYHYISPWWSLWWDARGDCSEPEMFNNQCDNQRKHLDEDDGRPCFSTSISGILWSWML